MQENLRDIHLPKEFIMVSSNPYILPFILSSIGILIFLYLTIWYLRRPTMKKEALFLLDEIERNYNKTNDSIACLDHLSKLLRRVAITEDERVAAIVGDDWLKYLDQGMKSQKDSSQDISKNSNEFSHGVGKIIAWGPYSQESKNETMGEVLSLCRKWVEAK